MRKLAAVVASVVALLIIGFAPSAVAGPPTGPPCCGLVWGGIVCTANTAYTATPVVSQATVVARPNGTYYVGADPKNVWYVPKGSPNYPSDSNCSSNYARDVDYYYVPPGWCAQIWTYNAANSWSYAGNVQLGFHFINDRPWVRVDEFPTSWGWC